MSYNLTLPSDLRGANLRAMQDDELLAHEDHYDNVLNTVQAERECITEVAASAGTLLSAKADAWLTEQARRCEVQVTNWMLALQMTCTERKRRDEQGRQDAYNVSLLTNTADLLASNAEPEAARICRDLVTMIVNGDPFVTKAEEVTAGVQKRVCENDDK
jgi:acetylglutamate synthase